MPRSRVPSAPARPGPRPGAGACGTRVRCPEGPRRTPRQARSRETVEAILDAAAFLLETEGFRAASTNAIARRAGVSIGSLYQFFASREEVFRALLDRHGAEVRACVARVLASPSGGEEPPARILARLLRELVRMHRGRPVLAHAMATQLAHLATEAARREEGACMDALAARVAAGLAVPHVAARAWMAVELTAAMAHRLAHDPPSAIPEGELLGAFEGLLAGLLGAGAPGGHDGDL